jgi:hypothetical protein
VTIQLTFGRVLEEAAEADERRRRLMLDRHRERVQTWFDELATADKEQLAEWFAVFEYETCVALSAAAGDHRVSRVANGK